MSLMQLVYYPQPVLLKPCEPVTEFDNALRRLVDDMFQTMDAASGAGLAAPQVGIAKRLFVMNCKERGTSTKLVVANPKIVHTSGRTYEDEGCLSVPGYYYKVQRPRIVVIRGQDINGGELEYEGVDFEAKCLMHETDHCDGQLYISRLTFLKRQQITNSIEKRIRAGKWPFEHQSLNSSGYPSWRSEHAN